jgi:glycosyltransferase involved in cell wall biosynthesis
MNENPKQSPPYPLHILMVTTDSEICGTERIMLSLLRNVDREKFNASVVTLFGPGDLVEEVKKLGYPAVNLRMKEDSLWQGLKRWRKFLGEQKPDVIQSLLIHSNILGRFTTFFWKRRTAMLGGISTVYTVEGYGKLYAYIERGTHFMDDLYCVNSELGMKQVKEAICLPEKKLALVHNGVQLMDDPPDIDAVRNEVRHEFGFGDDDLVVGIVAQLRPPKRHDILVHSVQALKSTFPHLRLLIVGTGEREEELKTFVSQNQLQEHVMFTGFRMDARRLLYGMDIFGLPSEVEGEPVSVMEAMNAGLPVAAAATGGIPEITQDGITSLLSTPGDQNGFTEILKTLLIDGEMRRRMGEVGKTRVRELFSAERMTREFEALYEGAYRLRHGILSP